MASGPWYTVQTPFFAIQQTPPQIQAADNTQASFNTVATELIAWVQGNPILGPGPYVIGTIAGPSTATQALSRVGVLYKHNPSGLNFTEYIADPGGYQIPMGPMS